MFITKKHISRRALLRCAFIAFDISRLLNFVMSATSAARAAYISSLLDGATALLARAGTAYDWCVNVVQAELPFFHTHGTGRPPQFNRVLSQDLGYAF